MGVLKDKTHFMKPKITNLSIW